MSEVRGLKLGASVAIKERRLAALLAGAEEARVRAEEAAADARVAGSLELAGLAGSVAEAGAARRGEPVPPRVEALVRATRAIPREAPFTVAALRAWHAAAVPGGGRFRERDRSREGGPEPAPPAFVESRLQVLEDWLAAASSRELKPAQAGALVLARVLEIMPFDEGNGLVARLAASHVVVRAGGRAPILVGADRDHLDAALRLAYQLQTEPLAVLLEQAEERALDVMIAALEQG